MATLFAAEIEYILRCAEEKSFGRAASKLGLSQPALTKAVQRFEKRIGATLFERTTRGVELTEAGHVLLQSVYSLSAKIDDAIEEARDLSNGQTGLLRLGLIPSISDPVIKALFPKLMDERPAATLRVELESIDVLMRGLQNSDYSLVVCPIGDELPTGIKAEVLFREDFFVIVRKGHPLAEKQQLHLDELTNWNWIRTERNEISRRIGERLFTSRGLTLPKSQVEATNQSAIMTIVSRTDLIGFASHSSLHSLEARERLVFIPVEEFKAIRPIGLFTREGYVSSVTKRAVEILKAVFSESKELP